MPVKKEKPPSQEKRDFYPESELADEMAKDLQKKLIWDDVSGDWYKFSNGYWQKTSLRVALNTIEKSLSKQLPNGYSLTKLKNMAGFLQIRLVLTKWNNSRSLLPMKNGILNIETLEIEKHNANHKFKWCLPYNFEPKATCPTTLEWLERSTRDDWGAINAIRAAMYFALVGASDVQKFMELLGPGGTGKSTLVRLIEGFIGAENHATTDLKNLESNRFETAVLYGARVVFINDSSRYGGEVSTLKAASGGDPLRMEKKNQQQGQSFISECFIFIVSNEAIQSADYSSGLIRRRVPVIFSQQVTEADKEKWKGDGGIEKVMKNELPGLLNWVLSMGENAATLALGGTNGQLTKSQLKHLIETNKLAAWLEDNCVYQNNARIYTGTVPSGIHTKNNTNEVQTKLYPNYHQWCADNGTYPLSLQRFGNSLEDLLNSSLKADVRRLEKDRKGRAFLGLAIRNNNHTETPTPIMNKIIRDEECRSCDKENTPQNPISDSCDGCDSTSRDSTNIKSQRYKEAI